MIWPVTAVEIAADHHEVDALGGINMITKFSKARRVATRIIIDRLAKVTLLILDDFGLKPLRHPTMKTSTTSSLNDRSGWLP